jgi:type I restriction enzyme S subunit
LSSETAKTLDSCLRGNDEKKQKPAPTRRLEGGLCEYRFSDLYEMSSGISSTPAQAGHGAPFLSFSTVFNNYFLPDVLPDLMDTSASEQQTYSVKEGDIFLTRTSETVDELGMSCVALKDYPNATFSGFLKRLRPVSEQQTDARFMAFYLRSPLFRKTMTNNAVMVLRASLNEQIFSYLKLLLPDFDTQTRIGEFLHLLHAKIDLNNRINAELEALAKTIYDYWFVQFDFPDANGRPYKTSGGSMVWDEALKREIPAGWEAKTLGSVISRAGTGLNPRDNFVLGMGNNYYVTIKSVTNGRIVLDDKCDRIDDESMAIIDRRSQLRAGDVLFTSIEPVGVTYLIHEKPTNWNINESVFTLRPDTDAISPEYLLMLLSSSEMKAFTKNSSAGSIHKGIRHGVLKSFILPYAGKSLIDQFSSIIRPMLHRSHGLDKENRELTHLRDWLLPLLMNGQVRVG